MANIIEPNKRLFNTYHLLTKIIGWGLIALGIMWTTVKFSALLTRVGNLDEFGSFMRYEMPWGLVSYIATGIVTLGISQFLKYLIDDQYHPGWLLKHAFALISIYAVTLAVLLTVSCIISCVNAVTNTDNGLATELMILIFSSLFFGGAQVLILLGIALFIKNVMPVIEESRTLV